MHGLRGAQGEWDPSLLNQTVAGTAADMLADKGGTRLAAVQATATLRDAAAQLKERRAGCLLVTDGEALAGIVSERDFALALAREAGDSDAAERPAHGPAALLVRDIMTPADRLVCVEPDTGVGECMEIMRRSHIRHLPVLSTERVERQLADAIDSAASQVDNARDAVTAMRQLFTDALGDAAGNAEYDSVLADPAAALGDDRPM